MLIKFTTEQRGFAKEKSIFKEIAKIQKINKVRLPFPTAVDFGVVNYERNLDVKEFLGISASSLSEDEYNNGKISSKST